jgi:hypothetical protein
MLLAHYTMSRDFVQEKGRNMNSENYFLSLYNIDVSEKVKEKNGLNYLSWAAAWAEVKKRHPDAEFTIYEQVMDEFGNKRPWFVDPISNTCWVKTGVKINGIEHIEDLPIMNFRNKSILATEVTSMDANKSIQRSLTKACARHGLGLYIYEGEDLPEEAKEEKKKQEKAKTELQLKNEECFLLAKEKSKKHNDEVSKLCRKYSKSGNPKTIKDITDTLSLIDELSKLD